MAHKNIAVLITALDSDAQAETLRGIREYGIRNGYNVAVFLWFTGAYEKDKHNRGEVNIVDLPDLSLFDGVIVFANTMHIEYNRKKIEALIEGLTCPVISIGCKFSNSYSICTDNYAGMRALMEHFVHDHGMRRIHFVKGVEGNEDGEARFRAYVDVLAENNIPLVQERISQGDFYVTGAKQAAQEILNSRLPFPEAIVCANDIMALTIERILEEHGYHIPEDVVISGYDYSMEARSKNSRIATVRTRFFELGEKACEILVERLEDGDSAALREVLIPDEVVWGDCCPFVEHPKEDPEESHFLKNQSIDTIRVIHQMVSYQKNVMEGIGFENWLNSLKEFIDQIAPSEFYYCVSDDFVSNIFECDMLEQEDVTAEEKLEYSPISKVLLAYQNGLYKHKASFESKYALDDLFTDSEQSKFYIFSPIHYLEKNFGYFVFVDTDFPMGNLLYISWLINVGHSIENIRQQSLLRNAMKRLDEMYIRDSLTGAYNRFGLERYFLEIKKRCMVTHSSMQLSFVDLDNLKQINDKYGHEEGDRIITAAAKVLQKCAGKYYVVRYGGDEFIVMGTVNGEAEVNDYWQNVQREVENYNNSIDRPAKLSLSYGYEIFKVVSNTTLEECIRVADGQMYTNKNDK